MQLTFACERDANRAHGFEMQRYSLQVAFLRLISHLVLETCSRIPICE